MKYLSVCSGIEAATVAWHTLGWEPVAFSEIEKFPAAVLKHHYPNIPNYGDMTKYKDWPDANISLLVGGTPCQSFSIAGLRKGLTDPRGDLMLTFGAIASRYRPTWLVWENVPGVLSSNGGRDFGTFLGMLAELGYGFAYRVLDAQYYGVAQRRRRVFVVGYLGDWRPPAAVLFESESLSGDSPPSREKGEEVAALTTSGVGTCGADDNQGQSGHLIITGPLCSNGKAAGSATQQDAEQNMLIPLAFQSYASAQQGMNPSEISPTLDIGKDGDPMFTLTKGDKHAVCYENHMQDSRVKECDNLYPQINAKAGTGGGNLPLIQQQMQVRRLTPIECERLQGFPDGYTMIPKYAKPRYKDLEEMAEYCGFNTVQEYIEYGPPGDGTRYKALGNSMAVPVMKWIGERIEKVEEML